MKLMFCEDCAALVVPSYTDMDATFCRCKRNAVWWRNGSQGLISFHDTHAPGCYNYQKRAFLIGINNAVFNFFKEDMNTPDHYKMLTDTCPPSYMFHTCKSNIIRARPGLTSDSQWEDKLPQT